MENHQLVNQSSGEVEFYSDPVLVGLARKVMGGIYLDPASCEFANRNFIGAKKFYSKEDNGLSKSWHGSVWLNHPFGKAEFACAEPCKKKICVKRGHHCDEYRPGNADWINHLMNEFLAFHVQQFCCITFAATSESWFRPLTRFPQCYLSPRTNYYGRDGKVIKGVTKGSVITYGGPNGDLFAELFDELGWVK